MYTAVDGKLPDALRRRMVNTSGIAGLRRIGCSHFFAGNVNFEILIVEFVARNTAFFSMMYL